MGSSLQTNVYFSVLTLSSRIAVMADQHLPKNGFYVVYYLVSFTYLL